MSVLKKINFLLDALEDGETNFRFDETRAFHRDINKSLNRLRGLYDREIESIREQERYYAQMLDNVQTGVLVTTQDEKVIYVNKQALALLGMSSLSNIRQLEVLGDEVYKAFSEVDEGNDQKITYYSESAKMHISLSATYATIEGKEAKIITFNDISSTLEEAENDSWTRLIRVLTHEIMNTVTPIASLSEALKDVEGEELQAGLETISTSSRSLIKFVNSYRDLTRVSAPVKKAFFVRDLISNVLELSRLKLSESECTATFTEKQDDILLYADQGQISQILINLIKNAVQAGAKNIALTADIDSNDSVIIDVTNDGSPISPSSQEEIFVPFFTTKQDGTGIGLSLSKQIMRLHGGNIRLSKSDEYGTTFTLIFK